MDFRSVIKCLKTRGVLFERGLDESEIRRAEELYKIKFPPDLKEFLTIELPTSNNFVNWRDISQSNIEKIKDRLNWPLEGMIFDIENNAFWYEGWGEKPESISEAMDLCKEEMEKVPRLIPICSHRYIPSEPSEVGNPIFSVYQTDIIYYGENLASYLLIEFDFKKYEDMDFESIKKISFGKIYKSSFYTTPPNNACPSVLGWSSF